MRVNTRSTDVAPDLIAPVTGFRQWRLPRRASATAAYQPVGVVPRLVRAATGAASNLPLDAEAGR
jgi:hypothetical protein